MRREKGKKEKEAEAGEEGEEKGEEVLALWREEPQQIRKKKKYKYI